MGKGLENVRGIYLEGIAGGRAREAVMNTPVIATPSTRPASQMGQGDFVLTYGKRHAAGKDIAVFDLYRVSSGKIVEHRMNEEEIGPRETWGNSGTF